MLMKPYSSSNMFSKYSHAYRICEASEIRLDVVCLRLYLRVASFSVPMQLIGLTASCRLSPLEASGGGLYKS